MGLVQKRCILAKEHKLKTSYLFSKQPTTIRQATTKANSRASMTIVGGGMSGTVCLVKHFAIQIPEFEPRIYILYYMDSEL